MATLYPVGSGREGGREGGRYVKRKCEMCVDVCRRADTVVSVIDDSHHHTIITASQ